jgi:hypothetical protein
VSSWRHAVPTSQSLPQSTLPYAGMAAWLLPAALRQGFCCLTLALADELESD